MVGYMTKMLALKNIWEKFNDSLQMSKTVWLNLRELRNILFLITKF
jgi:hypothetical protein